MLSLNRIRTFSSRDKEGHSRWRKQHEQRLGGVYESIWFGGNNVARMCTYDANSAVEK